MTAAAVWRTALTGLIRHDCCVMVAEMAAAAAYTKRANTGEAARATARHVSKGVQLVKQLAGPRCYFMQLAGFAHMCGTHVPAYALSLCAWRSTKERAPRWCQQQQRTCSQVVHVCAPPLPNRRARLSVRGVTGCKEPRVRSTKVSHTAAGGPQRASSLVTCAAWMAQQHKHTRAHTQRSLCCECTNFRRKSMGMQVQHKRVSQHCLSLKPPHTHFNDILVSAHQGTPQYRPCRHMAACPTQRPGNLSCGRCCP